MVRNRAILVVGSLMVLVVAGFALAEYGGAQSPYRNPVPTPTPPRGFVGMTPEQIGEYALQYTRNVFDVMSGTPRVRLVRPVTKADLLALGLGEYYGPDRPMVLVILQGDFDIRKGTIGTGRLDPDLWHWRVEFIGYVFDVQTGFVSGMMASPYGGRFRAALNDPSLPEDRPKPRPLTPVATPSRDGYRGPVPLLVTPRPGLDDRPPPIGTPVGR
ncbi:MAG: hypothetical protein HY331_18655 [Chloroflexi bacterium]|nr:hypothetical protein [Chloroflexota bacterium]